MLRLARILGEHLDEHGGGEAFVAPLDVVLSEHDVVEPDLILVPSAQTDIVTEPNIKGAPALLAEILSDPATDRKRKRALYARAGVLESWIVDPDADRVEVYRLVDGDYPKPQILEPGDTLATPLMPGLAIDVTGLLAR